MSLERNTLSPLQIKEAKYRASCVAKALSIIQKAHLHDEGGYEKAFKSEGLTVGTIEYFDVQHLVEELALQSARRNN